MATAPQTLPLSTYNWNETILHKQQILTNSHSETYKVKPEVFSMLAIFNLYNFDNEINVAITR